MNSLKPKIKVCYIPDYDIEVAKQLIAGVDIWLNTPLRPHEASGTSGMTAAMNGSVNVSTDDGWIPEFKKDEQNCFVLPALDHHLPTWDQDKMDTDNLYNIIENKVIPIYYDEPDKWQDIVFKAMDDVIPAFTAQRMADEYYKKLF